MYQAFVLLVTFATTVHTVFGCCWHHAHAARLDYRPALGDFASDCRCDSHGRRNSHSGAACESEKKPVAQDVEILAGAGGSWEGATPHEADCGGAKCTWLRLEESTDCQKATADTPAGAVLATVAGSAPRVALGDWGEARLLVYEVWRPVRTHLWLQILLI